jgi:hypothetical protein
LGFGDLRVCHDWKSILFGHVAYEKIDRARPGHDGIVLLVVSQTRLDDGKTVLSLLSQNMQLQTLRRLEK